MKFGDVSLHMITEILAYTQSHVGWILTISSIFFVFGLIVMPILAICIPPNYFLSDYRNPPSRFPPHIGIALAVIKNIVGAFCVVTGILLLVLPGQGLITLILGLMIMNYPGKYALERRLIRLPNVLSTINWLRDKFEKQPLESP
ncbi:MAG: PGPGW domain-containing protein [Candidatus Rariloculaceae bacterium]